MAEPTIEALSLADTDVEPSKASTLSILGDEFAGGDDIYKRYSEIMLDIFDPQSNPNGHVLIAIAENAVMQMETAAFLNDNFKLSAIDVSYGDGPWGSRRLCKAMANFMNDKLKPHTPVEPEHLVFANGVTSCCEMLGFTLGNPGDGILLPRPIYQAFRDDFGLRPKLKCVFASFGDIDQFSLAAVARYEDAIAEARKEGITVRAMVLCNPHNPLGRCYTQETIIDLMKLCQKYQIHLISDELYAMSVYEVPEKDVVPFTSALSFDSSQYIDTNLLHIVYGMSKDFAANGLRLGCMYVRNSRMLQALRSMGQFYWPSNPCQSMFSTILEDQQWLEQFFAKSQRELAVKSKMTRDILDAAGIKYATGFNSGFFIWVDLRPFLDGTGWAAEEALKKKFYQQKVLLTAGKDLSAEEPGFFRIIFTQQADVLQEGLSRVLKAIGKA